MKITSLNRYLLSLLRIFNSKYKLINDELDNINCEYY